MLTVIIVSFNSAEVIRRCMTDFFNTCPHRILIIDNASPNGGLEGLSDRYPQLEILYLEKNNGYGRAANIGIRLTETPYALLLNPDIHLSTEKVRRMLAHIKNSSKNTAIWAPAVRKNDHCDQPPRSVQAVHGSAMLFDVEKIRTTGLFDENIFLFSEETDLCKRVIENGYGIQLCPDILFDHLSGQSADSSRETEYMRWWHFGWSQCYRITKHGQCTPWNNPRRKYFSYTLHHLLTPCPARRRKWKAKADGVLAFINGKQAFDASGLPQMTTTPPAKTEYHRIKESS